MVMKSPTALMNYRMGRKREVMQKAFFVGFSSFNKFDEEKRTFFHHLRLQRLNFNHRLGGVNLLNRI